MSHLFVGSEEGWEQSEKTDKYPKRGKESVAAACQVSSTEAVLHHLAIRPGCIGTRGPCLPCRHTPFLSPLPRFITQCSARHREALHHFPYTTAVRPLTATQPGSPYTQPGYMLPLRHRVTLTLYAWCREAGLCSHDNLFLLSIQYPHITRTEIPLH